MEEDTKKAIEDMQRKVEIFLNALNERMNKLRDVIYNYLEASSNIGLSSIKANLRSI
jgi:hypothetical protein